jgi:hypothetical protein
MTEEKKITVTFAPGAFDNFDGSQEELDELMAEIYRLVETGEIFEKGKPLNIDELIEEEPEYAEKILRSLNEDTPKRNLQ